MKGAQAQERHHDKVSFFGKIWPLIIFTVHYEHLIFNFTFFVGYFLSDFMELFISLEKYSKNSSLMIFMIEIPYLILTFF